jgi:dATP pyrophosphohydrolase
MVTGKIEDGEKAYQAALREAEEETGITGGDFFVVPNVSTFYDHFANVLRHVVVFLLMAEEGEEVTLSDEHCEYRWISAAETKELYVWTDQHRSVEAVLHLLDNPDAMNISKIKK